MYSAPFSVFPLPINDLIDRLALLPGLADIQLLPDFRELRAHVGHAHLLVVELGGVFADVGGDLHRAEFRAAHGAEVGDLVGVFRQGGVVEFLRGFGIEGEVELEIGRAHV